MPTSASAASPSSTSTSASTVASRPRKTYTDDDHVAQLNALYSLLENRYAERYPASEDMLRPAFRPSHYEDLMHELEEAPKRTWFGRQWLRWSKLVRFN